LVIDVLSRERLAPYLVATGHHETAALDLYAWTLRLSESFYPLLSVTEVALRNAIGNRIRQSHGSAWWEEPAFHDIVGKNAKGMVLRARNRRMETKGRVSHGCMIAELTFGFWTNMLLPKYEQHYWTPLNIAFHHVPGELEYVPFAARCKAVTDLRNRIFHHEPLLNRDISRDYSDTLELVSWFDPALAEWIRPQLRVMAVLRQRPRAKT